MIAAIIAVGLIVAAMIVGAAVQNLQTGFANSARSANPVTLLSTALPQSTPTFVVRPPNIQQVKALAELSTVQTTMSTVVEASKARVGDIVYERLLLVACGRVKGGVDLSKMREGDISVSPDGRVVTVRLPKAELQDVYLIDDASQPCTTRVYDRTNLVVIPASAELEGQAREQALKAIRDMAIQSGVLTDANRNAKIVIERVLLSSGFDRVDFVSAP